MLSDKKEEATPKERECPGSSSFLSPQKDLPDQVAPNSMVLLLAYFPLRVHFFSPSQWKEKCCTLLKQFKTSKEKRDIFK